MSMAYLFSQNNTIRIGLQFFHKDTYFLWLIKRNLLSLHKIGCTRPFVSKLPWLSFALSLHKIGCTRLFVSKLPWHSFALSLHKIGCTRPFVSKRSWLDNPYLYRK